MAGPLSQKLKWEQANPLWAQALNPLLSNPRAGSKILQKINLINGVTIIPHRLGRMQQGWSITDINGAATIFRSAPFNSTNLTLTSDAVVTVNIEVF